MFLKYTAKPNKVILGGLVFVFVVLLSGAAYAGSKPEISFISPAQGSSTPRQTTTISSGYSDQDGWEDIAYAMLLIGDGISAKNSFYAYYAKEQNKVYLRNDEDTSWIGGYAPGTDNEINNSAGTIHLKETSVSGLGNQLVIRWAVSFKKGFQGQKQIYLAVIDKGLNLQSAKQMGSWEVLPGAPGIDIAGFSPSNAAIQANRPIVFTAKIEEPKGYKEVSYAILIINTQPYGAGGIWVVYDFKNTKLNMLNDEGNRQVGEYPAGSNHILENSFGVLDCKETKSEGEGNILTVTWQIYFKADFEGAKKVYIYAKNTEGKDTGTVQEGILRIFAPQEDKRPPLGSVIINEDAEYSASSQVRLAIEAKDEESPAGIRMQISNDAAIWSDWEVLSSPKEWQLSEGEGLKAVYIRFKDLAENISPIYSDNIILDLTPPAIETMYPADGSRVYIGERIDVRPILKQGDPQPLRYRFSINEVVRQDWSGNGKYTWTPIESEFGRNKLKVEVEDRAGVSVREAEVFVLHQPVIVD